MLNRTFLLLILLFLSPLSGGEVNNAYFISGELRLSNSEVVAYSNAVILFQDKYMKAREAVYHKDSESVELFGDITLIERGLYFFVGEYAKITIDNDNIIKDMFLYHKPRHLWLYTKEASSKNDIYKINDSYLSSCRSEDPDWGFYIKEGSYDKAEERFKLYNIILYAKDFPVLYFPYLSFSTKTRRESGLLFPEFGYGNNNGIFYGQPIYYVPNEMSDIEITPQYRSDRGEGVYAKYRFADSPYSRGYIQAGYFNNNSEYYKDKELQYREHRGMDIYYKRNRLFESLWRGSNDALLLDITLLSDIDYINLREDQTFDSEITNVIESKINYFISNGNSYWGLYNRYTIDTNKGSNEGTLQLLPHSQYHHYTDSLWDSFLYSFDYQFKNFHREEGATAIQHDITVPITYYTSFFDNYLLLKVSENFYASYIDFSNTVEYQDKSNTYFRQYHEIEIFTDLSKEYRKLFHNINFGIRAVIPDLEKSDGFYNPEENFEDGYECVAGDPCEFKRVDKVDRSINLRLSQYLFNHQGDEVLYHRFLQPIVIENSKPSLDYVENEFRYFINRNLSLYNNLNFSYKESKIEQISSSVDYKREKYDLSFSHFKKDLSDDNVDFITSRIALKPDDKYRYFGHYSYDILNESMKSWGLGFDMEKRCWNYSIQYKEELQPSLSKSGTSAIKNNMLYFKVELYPLGGFDYEVKE
jgi:LPS-assembly protein